MPNKLKLFEVIIPGLHFSNAAMHYGVSLRHLWGPFYVSWWYDLERVGI